MTKEFKTERLLSGTTPSSYGTLDKFTPVGDRKLAAECQNLARKLIASYSLLNSIPGQNYKVQIDLIKQLNDEISARDLSKDGTEIYLIKKKDSLIKKLESIQPALKDYAKTKKFSEADLNELLKAKENLLWWTEKDEDEEEGGRPSASL